MKSLLCVCVMGFGAIASSGCGSSASAKSVIGSYDVMISSMGKSDPDVMTVAEGTGGKLLLTFVAGVTTDPTGLNANGLRADLHGSSMLSLEMQPVHIDHSTGAVDGSASGMGTLMGDGSCDITLHFTDGAGATQDYEIMGAKE
jgi:hypothetical protein